MTVDRRDVAPTSPDDWEAGAAARRLELALAAAGLGAWDWDLESGRVSWDVRTLELFGLREEEFDGRIETFFRHVHPDDEPDVRAAIEAAVAACGGFSAEFRVLSESGIRWAQSRGRVYADEATGSPARMLGVIADATEVRGAQEQVARTLEHMTDAFFALDLRWRFSYVNARAERLLRRRREELLGRVVWAEFAEAVGTEFERRYRRALASGEPEQFEDYYAPLGIWVEVRVFPGPDGLAVYFRDITERRRAEDEREALLAAEREARRAAERAQARLQFLAKATAVVSSSLNRSEILESLARLALPTLADWCAIYLREGDVLERSLVVHTDPSLAEAAAQFRDAGPLPVDAPQPVAEVVRTGRPLVVEELTERWFEERGYPPQAAAAARRMGVRAGMTVPLIARGRAIGAMSFALSDPSRSLTQDDVRLAQEFARRAALAVDNADRYEQESAVADALQRAVLPESLPQVPGVRLAASYVPAAGQQRVGGDWFDAFPLGDDRLAVVVGDVAGHGLRAAALMGQLRNALRAYALDDVGPAATLARLDLLLCRLEPDVTATVVVAEVAAATGAVRWASAGHLPPLLLAPGAQPQRLELPADPLLGCLPGRAYAEHSLDLAPGAALVLYTDGLVERRDESLAAGLDRVTAVAARLTGHGPQQICEALVSGMVPADGALDDVCVLVLGRT